MGFTNYWTYAEGDPTCAEWEALVAFAATASEAVDGTTCVTTADFIDITGNPGCENLVLYKLSSHADRAMFAGFGKDGGFCKTLRLPYNEVVVAVLIAAQQIRLVEYWRSEGDTDETRPGFELYYELCDNFRIEHGRAWWAAPPKTHAKAAAAFHAKWKELEPDLMNLATAAQALAALRGGSTTLVQLLEELNDIVAEGFNLLSRPFTEDPEGVSELGMLEVWRSELFDIVVNESEGS
jgi:hypothetical protein